MVKFNQILSKIAALVMAFTMMLSSVSAFAADATTASIWDHEIYVDGNLSDCLDASGQRLYPLNYNNSIYVPLRTVAEWMGKDAAKSADGKTFALSGTKEPIYRERIISFVEPEKTAAITVLSGAQLRVDGNTAALTDATGKVVNMISWKGEPYLPIRSVASMLGMSLKYVNPPYRNFEVVYMRTPLTDEQLKACKEYASILSNADLEFRTLFGEDNSYFNNLSQLSTAMKTVDLSRDVALKFKNTKRPNCKLLVGYYKKIDEVADQILKGCEVAEQLIQKKASVEQVFYVMAEDYTGESYYPSRIIPPDGCLGVEALCQSLTIKADGIIRVVNETA